MSARPRIAVLMEFPTALGGERSLLAVEELMRPNWDLVVFAPEYGSLSQELAQRNIDHVKFSFRDKTGLRKPDEEILETLPSLLQEQQIQLLHANSLTLSRFVGRFREEFALPATGHLRDIMQVSAKSIEDLNHLDGLAAVSKATLDCYLQQGLSVEKAQVIYNGIDRFPYEEDPRFVLIRELQLPPASKFAAVIGQIGLRKGHDLLFEALQTVGMQHPDWHFLILGERFSGKLESIEFVRQLERLIQQAGLIERVHWMGYMNDVPSVIQQCDLLIHPARQEPFGRVLLEAAVSGVAILATDVGGTGEMLENNRSACLVPPENPAELAQACCRLMKDATLREKLGEAAKKRVLSEFTLQRSADALATFWSKSLGGHAHSA